MSSRASAHRCDKEIGLWEEDNYRRREGRWVQFKYERLPNFWYRCGLLSHALKDCPEAGERNTLGEKEELQYGAWLRGEIFRRSSQDSAKFGMERGVGYRHGESDAEAE